MQVREGRARGLSLHLARLDAAHRDIYGKPLDGDLVRARIRHALDGRPGASVRVYGYWAGLIVTVRGPQEMLNRPYFMTPSISSARSPGSSTWAAGDRADFTNSQRQRASTTAC
jgi:hypothetical protein